MKRWLKAICWRLHLTTREDYAFSLGMVSRLSQAVVALERTVEFHRKRDAADTADIRDKLEKLERRTRELAIAHALKDLKGTEGS